VEVYPVRYAEEGGRWCVSKGVEAAKEPQVGHCAARVIGVGKEEVPRYQEGLATVTILCPWSIEEQVGEEDREDQDVA